MTINETITKMMKGEFNNLLLDNEEAFKMTLGIVSEKKLQHFKITINHTPGKTLFVKI